MTILARCAAVLALFAIPFADVPSADAAPRKECMTRQFRDFKVIRSGSVRVLYARGGRKAAARVAGYARETYPRFKEILRREPPADARERCFHGPDGKLDIYANDENWTLDWGFDDPSVGFMDASDPECYVYIWGYFDQEASQRRVPRSTFLQTTPFTVTFEGSGTATNTLMTNATINHEWRYSMTLQRVN